MSLLSYLLVAWHAEIIATDRKKMIRLRVISTFFQTSELTTLIQLSWPKFLFFTLPFQFPMSDVKCLAADVGLDREPHLLRLHLRSSVVLRVHGFASVQVS